MGCKLSSPSLPLTFGLGVFLCVRFAWVLERSVNQPRDNPMLYIEDILDVPSFTDESFDVTLFVDNVDVVEVELDI